MLQQVKKRAIRSENKHLHKWLFLLFRKSACGVPVSDYIRPLWCKEREEIPMTWSPILAFAIIALAFGIGDVIAAKTRGVISSVLVAILLMIASSTLLPENMISLLTVFCCCRSCPVYCSIPSTSRSSAMDKIQSR